MVPEPIELDPFIGRNFGSCRVDSKIAVGGYGMVYKATDQNLNTTRAVKLFHPHLSSEKGFRERFFNEMQLLAKLDHPNIVKIMFAIDEPDISGFVMEFVPGRDLADTLDSEGRVDVARACEVFLQIGAAIEYAHTTDPPIIHRDLAPDNVMIRPDRLVKIMDFGISKTINAERLTQTGIVLGKPMYMAPEQFEGQVTALCDQYALGIMLYEMLVGTVPFEGETPIAQYRARFRQKVEFPSDVARAIPERIAAAVLRATSREAKDRFENVSGFLREVEEGAPAKGVAGSARATGVTRRDPLEAVRLMMDLRQYREALNELDGLLAAKPEWEAAQLLRKEAARSLETREAERTLEAAHRLALEHCRKGRLEEAREQVEVFLACLEKIPRTKTHLRLKRELSRLMPRVVEEVEEREKERLETVRDLLAEARERFRARDHAKAIAVIDDLLELDPRNAEATELRSLCLDAGGREKIAALLREGLGFLHGERYEDALARFDAILAISPGHAEAARHRDIVHGQIEEREAKLERGRAKAVELVKFLEAGKRAYQNWDFNEAIRCFRVVLSLEENHVEARQLLEESRERLQDTDKVEEIGLQYNEGILFYQNRKFGEAIRCFDRVLEYFGQHKGAVKYRDLAVAALGGEKRIDALNREGIDLLRNQEYAKAFGAFRQVLAIDRTNRTARKYALLCQEMVKGKRV